MGDNIERVPPQTTAVATVSCLVQVHGVLLKIITSLPTEKALPIYDDLSELSTRISELITVMRKPDNG